MNDIDNSISLPTSEVDPFSEFEIFLQEIREAWEIGDDSSESVEEKLRKFSVYDKVSANGMEAFIDKDKKEDIYKLLSLIGFFTLVFWGNSSINAFFFNKESYADQSGFSQYHPMIFLATIGYVLSKAQPYTDPKDSGSSGCGILDPQKISSDPIVGMTYEELLKNIFEDEINKPPEGQFWFEYLFDQIFNSDAKSELSNNPNIPIIVMSKKRSVVGRIVYQDPSQIQSIINFLNGVSKYFPTFAELKSCMDEVLQREYDTTPSKKILEKEALALYISRNPARVNNMLIFLQRFGINIDVNWLLEYSV